MSHAPRQAVLRARLTDERADALAITDVPNLAYLTGFEAVFDDEPAHIGLVTASSTVVITDSRYFDALSAAAAGTGWRVVMARTTLAETLADELVAAGASNVALETSMPYTRFRSIESAVGVDVVECDGWVEQLRQVKDADEIARIEAAQRLTDAAFDHLIGGVLRAGVTERDVALELEFFMRRSGSEGVAFAPIVASGPNSARPHATPGDRAFADGDFVVLDFGARVGGYCADMTRTVVIGTATERHREIYDAVLAANAAGAAAVQANTPGRDIDAAARSVIVERGFGEYFGHGLGHGVGLEVHELPGLGPRSEAAVPLGSVVTIEPGIYVPGFGGVRIEDLATVEEAGARVLTRSTKALVEL
jgi:Xaa-Pro aminopeptidase